MWRPEEGQSERTEGLPEKVRKQESGGGGGMAGRWEVELVVVGDGEVVRPLK